MDILTVVTRLYKLLVEHEGTAYVSVGDCAIEWDNDKRETVINYLTGPLITLSNKTTQQTPSEIERDIKSQILGRYTGLRVLSELKEDQFMPVAIGYHHRTTEQQQNKITLTVMNNSGFRFWRNRFYVRKINKLRSYFLHECTWLGSTHNPIQSVPLSGLYDPTQPVPLSGERPPWASSLPPFSMNQREATFDQLSEAEMSTVFVHLPAVDRMELAMVNRKAYNTQQSAEPTHCDQWYCMTTSSAVDPRCKEVCRISRNWLAAFFVDTLGDRKCFINIQFTTGRQDEVVNGEAFNMYSEPLHWTGQQAILATMSNTTLGEELNAPLPGEFDTTELDKVVRNLQLLPTMACTMVIVPDDYQHPFPDTKTMFEALRTTPQFPPHAPQVHVEVGTLSGHTVLRLYNSTSDEVSPVSCMYHGQICGVNRQVPNSDIVWLYK